MDLDEKVDAIELIKAVRAHLCLYDKDIPAYRNQLIRKRAWSRVALDVGKDVELCQHRWRSLRDRFVKEATKTTTSESGAENNSDWVNFEAMSFLKAYIKPRKKGVKVSDLDCDSNPPMDEYSMCEKVMDEFLPTQSTMPSQPQPKKQKLVEASERFDKLMGIVEKMVTERKTDSKTRTEAQRSRTQHGDFFSVLEGLLNKLPEGTQDDLKFKMYDMTYKEVVNLNLKKLKDQD